jgi:SAM-dependent methyltransferase
MNLVGVEARASTGLSEFRDCSDILECPVTGEPLIVTEDGWVSRSGGRCYPIEEGISRLFAPSDPAMADRDVTEMVKAFYEQTPFPNYDDLDSRESLIARSRQGLFAAALDEQLPDRAVVLEAGCGTGQLTNFLGLSWKRRVSGGDICLNSLRLANGFREKYRIANAAFLQMNLFRLPFRDNSVDVVICNGVLHHTRDARAGFVALLRKVRPGGLILIGLYNTYARLPTLWRRWAFERFGPSLYFLDRRLTSARLSEGRWQAWFRDQYRHPHETRHSIDKVLGWFDASGIDFLSSVPAADGSSFTSATPLFRAAFTRHRHTAGGCSAGNASDWRPRWRFIRYDRAQAPLTFFGESDAHPGHIGLLPRQRRGADRGRPHHRCRPGGALHPPEVR